MSNTKYLDIAVSIFVFLCFLKRYVSFLGISCLNCDNTDIINYLPSLKTSVAKFNGNNYMDDLEVQTILTLIILKSVCRTNCLKNKFPMLSSKGLFL